MKNALLLAAAPLALSSCTLSTLGTLGHRAPSSLVDLYDQLAPDGAMEIEFDRNGAFLEMEADVPVSDVPKALIDATLAAYPDARITGAEREVQGELWTWEVKFESDGRAMEVVLDGAGRILETERELRPAEAPKAVLDAAEASFPGSQFISVEIIEAGATTTYHVKRSVGQARYKIVLSPEGKILRRVREARAEIEIPLE